MTALAQTPDRLASLALDDFTPHVGTKFVLPEIGRKLVLESAEPGMAPGDGLRAAFALVFRGEGDAALPQQIHALEHDALGRLDIFLVPIAREADGMRYEAVFA